MFGRKTRKDLEADKERMESASQWIEGFFDRVRSQISKIDEELLPDIGHKASTYGEMADRLKKAREDLQRLLG